MKKLFAASLLTLGLSISAFAVQTTPLNNKGMELDPKYGAVSSCEITSSTGTSALLCTSGSGIILEVYASSVAATDTIVFRDSATANTTSTVLLAVDKNSLDKQMHVFPRFNNGLSVNLLVAATGGGTASRPNWTVLYTKDLK